MNNHATSGNNCPETAPPNHTLGKWQWWTSCSWTRLRSDLGHGKTADVLMPTVRSDGQPDIIVSDGDMAMIVAAPDMFAALCTVGNVLSRKAVTTKDDELFAAFSQLIAAVTKARGSP